MIILNNNMKSPAENTRLTPNQLKSIYGAEYVAKYHVRDYRRIKRLLKYMNLRPNDRVLDIGCGNALLLDYIRDKIGSYIGVDFSEDFIKVAKERAEKMNVVNAHFTCEDIIDFVSKQPDKSFDKIFALDFVEHIYDNEFIALFSGLNRILKDGGELYIHTPNREYFLEILKAHNILRTHPEHIGVRTSKQYERILAELGFSNIKTINFPHYVRILYPVDLIRFVPIVGKYFWSRLFIICG